MAKQERAWKQAYREHLTAGNPDLSPVQVFEMTTTAWIQYRSTLRLSHYVATAERRGEAYRQKQTRDNPGFVQQQENRVKQLYNEMREENSELTPEEAMEQAKMLENREVVAVAQGEMLEKKKVRNANRKARKVKRKAQKVKMANSQQLRFIENARLPSLAAKEARTPEGQITNSLSRLSLAMKTPQVQKSTDEEHTVLTPESSTQVEARISAALTKMSRLQAERGVKAQNEAEKIDTETSRERFTSEDGAQRQDQMYQTAFKSKSTVKWLRQLTENEPKGMQEEFEQMQL